MIRIFKHYIPTTHLYLGVAEALVFFVAINVASVLYPSSPMEHIFPMGIRALFFCLVMMGGIVAVGLYQRHLRDSLSGLVLRLAVGYGLATIALSFSFYIVPGLFVGRMVLVTPSDFACRYCSYTPVLSLPSAVQRDSPSHFGGGSW